MKLKIVSAAYHRNGVSGEGFYAVLFDDLENEDRMIASIFEDILEERTRDHNLGTLCSVFSVAELAKGNIEFAQGNSWRGDEYEDALRPLVKKFIEDKRAAQR